MLVCAARCKCGLGGLKIRRGQPHGGSIPPPGTTKNRRLIGNMREGDRSPIQMHLRPLGVVLLGKHHA